jgi:hypothetical protein
VIRLPENLGIYLSTLYMSICRGDLPSAKLAYRHLCLKPQPLSLFKDILSRAALFHFSVIPTEISNLTLQSVWDVISGMCKSSIDNRALSLSIMELNKNHGGNIEARRFHIWLKNNQLLLTSPLLLQKRLMMAAVKYLIYQEADSFSILEDDSYFLYNKEPFLEVEVINSILPEYYLGDWSWFRVPVERSLGLMHPDLDIASIIDVFEINKTAKNIQFKESYWEPAKYSLFRTEDKTKEMEGIWEKELKPKALQLITTLQESRLPIQTSG